MAEENVRVDFAVPASLIERADGVAEILDISRTRLIITALEDYLDKLANDEEFRRRLSGAYYDDRIDYETVEALLGRESAMRLKLLRESIDQAVPEPRLDGDPASDEE